MYAGKVGYVDIIVVDSSKFLGIVESVKQMFFVVVGSSDFSVRC